MAHAAAVGSSSSPAGVNADRLFLGSCLALIATAASFAVVGAIMGPLKTQFVLSNQQVGWIGGAQLFGFPISMVLFGTFVDNIGMKNLTRFAFIAHVIGVLTLIFATGFTMLFAGALIISMGNGLVEAACNPLVASLYPSDKTVKLNRFHVWFPGGIVLGGLATYFLDMVGIADWRIKAALILIPAIAAGIIFFKEEFPVTERVQSGYTTGQMWGAILNPLFLVLLACMAITASLELGPGRWIPTVLTAGGISGILVLVYMNGLMAVLRFRAGDIVHRIPATGVLFVSSILAGVGLYLLSFAESTAAAFGAATIFALGVTYFWPTMLGLVAERNPRGGSLALALIGGMGMAAVGAVASPQMGRIADENAHQRYPQAQTVAVLEKAAQSLPAAAAQAPANLRGDIEGAAVAVQTALQSFRANGTLPEGPTAAALRAITANGGADPVVGEANAILQPADNYGGRVAFRALAPLSIILMIVFGILFMQDRRTLSLRTTENAQAGARVSA